MDYKVTDTELTSIANAIRTKGGTSDLLTFPNEFITAVQNIPSGGSPNLQTKSKTYTPTLSKQTDSVSADSGYDGIDTVNITVNAMPEGTAGTPIVTKSTVTNHTVTFTPRVTNTTGYITGDTKIGTPMSATASELVSGTLNITSSGTKDVTNYASVSVPSGTEGTPTATKSTVSNHSVSVLPSVTNSSGFITGTTKTGTAVTISANELVSGSETKTENGTYDVTNLAELVVDVPSGGASNFVQGEFHTGTTTTAQTIDIPYTGSGYPIMAYIVVKGGAYVSGTDWYTTIHRYAVGVWSMSKNNMSLTPSFATSGAENQAVTTWIYKSSTSSATSYSRSSAMNTNSFSSGNASSAGATCVRFKSTTRFTVVASTTSYGLSPDTDYQYFVVYSS